MDCLRSLKNGIFPQGLPLKKNKNQKTLEKGKKQNQNTSFAVAFEVLEDIYGNGKS